MDAAIALLCRVSTTNEGITLLVDWFAKLVEHQAQFEYSSNPTDNYSTEEPVHKSVNPEILHCFAAILWNVNEEVASLITESLFRYELSVLS